MQTIQEQIAGIQDAIAKCQTAHKNAVSAHAKRQITAMIKRYQQTLAFLLKQEQK